MIETRCFICGKFSSKNAMDAFKDNSKYIYSSNDLVNFHGIRLLKCMNCGRVLCENCAPPPLCPMCNTPRLFPAEGEHITEHEKYRKSLIQGNEFESWRQNISNDQNSGLSKSDIFYCSKCHIAIGPILGGAANIVKCPKCGHIVEAKDEQLRYETFPLKLTREEAKRKLKNAALSIIISVFYTIFAIAVIAYAFQHGQTVGIMTMVILVIGQIAVFSKKWIK
jgi:rubrerythrin